MCSRNASYGDAMNLIKQKIISDIKNNLGSKIERFYIFGSFLENNWNQDQSDIDLICIDSSFENFSYSVNLHYIKNILAKLPYKFDIFLYTWNQFYTKIDVNPRFSKEIKKAIMNGKNN